jgi:hypothetical protein
LITQLGPSGYPACSDFFKGAGGGWGESLGLRRL